MTKYSGVDAKKFDSDLRRGQVAEQLWHVLVGDDSDSDRLLTECKSEWDWWQKTGNLCFEYRWDGQPSGIAVTRADWWFHALCDPADGRARLCIVFRVDLLKDFLRKCYLTPKPYGAQPIRGRGDQGLVDGLLVPMEVAVRHAC